MFYRERGALPYDPFAYGIAIALVEIPYLILQVQWLLAWLTAASHNLWQLLR